MHLDMVCMANCKQHLFLLCLSCSHLCSHYISYIFFFRGLNDKDSRTSFHHIINIGAKNVYRIFAGGNHSWVVIDDIIPIRRKYRPPSPVPDNK